MKLFKKIRVIKQIEKIEDGKYLVHGQLCHCNKQFEIDEVETTELALIGETVDYLLGKEGGGTITNIRRLIANLYNCNHYPAPDLFSMMRSADRDHEELIVDIIQGCGLKYGDSCFLLINDLAPLVIDRLHI